MAPQKVHRRPSHLRNQTCLNVKWFCGASTFEPLGSLAALDDAGVHAKRVQLRVSLLPSLVLRRMRRD